MERERDLGARAFQLQALSWGLAGGGSIGALFGFLASSVAGWPFFRTVALGFLIGSIVIYLGIVALAQASTAAVVSTVAPSGSGIPIRAEYSLARTYVVQGRYPEAVTQYERHIAEDPTDPEPCLLLARLYRDELKQMEGAIKWFRQAVAVATDPGIQYLGVRELTEVFVTRLEQPRRALPDLAKLADRHPGTVGGRWAREQVAQLKGDLSWER